MMESIEKLRNWANNYLRGGQSMEAFNALYDEIEAEIECDYMKLPCDYEGEPLHIGDVTNEGKVASLLVRDDGESSVYVYKLPNVLHEFACYEVTHFKPRTLEDVLRDFAKEVNVSSSDFISVDGEEAYMLAAINETADEIRELLGGDAE